MILLIRNQINPDRRDSRLVQGAGELEMGKSGRA